MQMKTTFLLFLFISFHGFCYEIDQGEFYSKFSNEIKRVYARIYSDQRDVKDIERLNSELKAAWEQVYKENVTLTGEHCIFWIAAHGLISHQSLGYPDYDIEWLKSIYISWKNNAWEKEILSKCRPITPPIIRVSIVHLIFSPDKFDGKLVSVKGVLSAHFEGSNIFFSRESYNFVDFSNSVQISSAEGDFSKYDGKSVWISGRFYAKNCMNTPPDHIVTGCIKFSRVIHDDMDTYRNSIGLPR